MFPYFFAYARLFFGISIHIIHTFGKEMASHMQVCIMIGFVTSNYLLTLQTACSAPYLFDVPS